MKKTALAFAVVLGAAATASAQGTALSVTIDDPAVSCQASGATVTAGYTFSTTAASLTTVTRTLTDSNAVAVANDFYVIPSGESLGGWTFAGRTKTHDALVQYSGLADGSYTLEVCGIQPGSGGNPDKKVCDTLAIVVNCAEASVNPCANTGPFGEVVGNTQIKANATAQIQFRGNLGPSALVEVTMDGFYRSAFIPRNGDSCTYHANWKFSSESGADFFGNAGAGVYTVKVTGSNGNEVPLFSVTLTDPKGGK